MKKALVLCGGVPQIALINELKARGIETILLDMNENVGARSYADRFYPVSVMDVDAVRKVAVGEKVDYIFSVCADQVLLVVAQLCEELGLPWYIDYETAKNVSSKSLMKKIFVDNGIPTTKYAVSSELTPSLTQNMAFPLIVKPIDSYSSRGVRKVTNAAELGEAFSEALRISRTNTAIVEEFAEGTELSVDVYVEDGKAHVLCVSQLDKLQGIEGFVINRCSCPAPIPQAAYEQVCTVCQQIADAFGLYNSPMLVQLILSGDKVSVLEFCARTGGGDKFRLIAKAAGFDVVKAVVELTLGNKPHVVAQTRESRYIVDEFLYCHAGVLDHLEGFEELLADGTITEYFPLKQPGAVLREPTCSGDRVAYFTVQANDYDTVLEKRAAACRRVRALDKDGNDLLRHDLTENFTFTEAAV